MPDPANALLFITVPNTSHKLINRLLLSLRDWEYGADLDTFHLVTTKNAYDFDPPPDEPTKDLPGTEPGSLTAEGWNADATNAWAGADFEDVEAFMQDAEKNSPHVPTLFLVFDAKGEEDGTVILVEKHYYSADEVDDDSRKPKHVFDKYRVPWAEAHIIVTNLWIANMNFDEFADDKKGVDADGWWVYSFDGSELDEDQLAVKNAAFEELEREGKI